MIKNTKIYVPLKYSSNFFSSLEMSLINCKIYSVLNYNNNCVMHGADTDAGVDHISNRETTFQITAQNFMFRLSLYQLKICKFDKTIK